MLQEAKAVRESRQIERAFNELSKAVSEANSLATEVFHRLEPALRPAGSEACGGPLKDSPPLAPLAIALGTEISRIESLNATMREILQRLEL